MRALAVLVAAAFLTLAGGLLADGSSLWSLVPAALFTLLATAGFEWVRRQKRNVVNACYVVLQLVIGYATFGMSGAAVGSVLLLVVLVSQSVLILPTRWVIAVVAVVPLVHVGMDVRSGIREGLGTLAAAVFAAVLTQLLVREQQARGEVAEAHRRLQAYALQVERLAATQERNRVARDIHDGLGHALTVVQMQVKAARAVLATDAGRADELLAKAQNQAEAALADVRRSVSALREPRTVALADALRELADEVSAAGVPTTVEVAGPVRRLAADAEESLFRAAQEGLTNVRKHAQATSAALTLDYSRPEQVRLHVRDDGVGLAAISGGFGLLGVRERADHVGGRMSVESLPGKGSELVVEVPG
jgi:signal transduction histidine kinase